MRKISALIFVTIISLFTFASCKGDEKTVTLNVYNWGEYISDGSDGSYDTNYEFEKYFNTYLSAKYGGVKVKVNYTTYPTNEDMYSKLSSGSGAYDVICPSDYMIERLISEDMLLPLNWDGVKGERYDGSLNSEYVGNSFDPEAKYSAAYTYGRTGIIYNTKMVDEEDIGSWDLLWNPKYKGKILQFNNPRDAFGTAMYWKNIDINSNNEEDWNAALELLKEQKPYLQGYVNDEVFDKMTGESAAIATYFVGDFVTMYSENDDLAFYYPKEGTNVFVDAFCIPTSSKNPDIAMEYINFMLSPDAAIANAIYLGYSSPSRYVYNDDPALDEIYGEYNQEYLESLANDFFLDPEDENNPTDEEYAEAAEKAEEIFALLYEFDGDFEYTHNPIYRNFEPDIQRHTNSLWEELKIYGTSELWVHLTSGALILTVLVWAIYSVAVKKYRSRNYRLRDKALREAKKTKTKI